MWNKKIFKLEGSQESVITHLVFNLTSKSLQKMEVPHIILKVGLSKTISEQKIFTCFFICQNIHISI